MVDIVAQHRDGGKSTGWYRAFRDNRLGSLGLGEQEIAVRAIFTRSHDSRLGVWYHTKASQKYVTGFAEQHRPATTMEPVPA